MSSANSLADPNTWAARRACRGSITSSLCPVRQGRAVDLDALPGEDLALPVKRKVIAVLGDQDMSEKTGTGKALGDRTLRGRRLMNSPAGPAAIARPADADVHQSIRRDRSRHTACRWQSKRVPRIRVAPSKSTIEAARRNRTSVPSPVLRLRSDRYFTLQQARRLWALRPLATPEPETDWSLASNVGDDRRHGNAQPQAAAPHSFF